MGGFIWPPSLYFTTKQRVNRKHQLNYLRNISPAHAATQFSHTHTKHAKNLRLRSACGAMRAPIALIYRKQRSACREKHNFSASQQLAVCVLRKEPIYVNIVSYRFIVLFQQFFAKLGSRSPLTTHWWPAQWKRQYF